MFRDSRYLFEIRFTGRYACIACRALLTTGTRFALGYPVQSDPDTVRGSKPVPLPHDTCTYPNILSPLLPSVATAGIRPLRYRQPPGTGPSSYAMGDKHKTVCTHHRFPCCPDLRTSARCSSLTSLGSLPIIGHLRFVPCVHCYAPRRRVLRSVALSSLPGGPERRVRCHTCRHGSDVHKTAWGFPCAGVHALPTAALQPTIKRMLVTVGVCQNGLTQFDQCTH